MCFNFIDYGIQTIRSIIGCICCLVITGPILLIVGVVMLVSPNYYADKVNQYNQGWATFQSSGDMAAIQATNGTIPTQFGVSFYPSTSAMTVTGEGVTSGITSYPLVSSNSVYMYNGATVALNSPFGSSSITLASFRNSPITSSFTARCSSSSSSSSSNRNSNSYCYTSDMINYCNNRAPSGCSATYFGPSSCSSGSSCGTCTYTQYVSSLCFVLTRATSTSPWTLSTAKGTCSYSGGSWNQQPKTCTSSSSSYLNVKFLDDKDPAIVLEAVTQGTGSFGLTEAQQRGTGLALMAVGGLLVAGVVGTCALMCRAFNQNPQHKQRAYGAFGMQYTPAPGYAPMGDQGVAYAQPVNATAYPAQPVGYAPQPVGYPPQPYAQQPVGYPPQPYSQPQQGYAAYPPQPQY